MKRFLLNNLQPKKILWLLFITGGLYALMLTVTIPNVMAHAGGMQILDMQPMGYSPEYVNALMQTLGEAGRNSYLFRQIPVDMLYPGLSGITFALLLAYILKKLGKEHTALIYLCALPLLAVGFDYLENFGIISILSTYPANSNGLSVVTSWCTVLKSMLMSACFLVLGVALVVWLIMAIIRRGQR